MPLRAGDAMGPYEIVSAIGQGGMGAVYRARDPRLGRDVAIKVSAEEFGERFEREARTIASLNHPNICTLHDVGPNYLVMELVEGTTLAERVEEGAIPLEESLGIARQIAEALEAAHNHGVIHRDPPEPEISAPTALFPVRFRAPISIDPQQYEVSPDGQRFLARVAVDEEVTPLTVILNWGNPTR